MELYNSHDDIEELNVTVEVNDLGVAVIRQGKDEIAIPYEYWGEFSDSVERFYTRDTPETKLSDWYLDHMEESPSYRQSMRDSGHGGMLR